MKQRNANKADGAGKGRFREVGGQVTGFYRYNPGNRVEILASFQHREQIGRFCQRLQLRLEAEYDLAALKAAERQARSLSRDSADADHNQLELMALEELIVGTDASVSETALFASEPERSNQTDSVSDTQQSRPQRPARTLEESLSEIPTLGPASAGRSRRKPPNHGKSSPRRAAQ